MKNVALVGFMGCGKSTVGRAVAELLDFAFVDSDRVIEAKMGKAIPEIFASDGEAAFRRAERETITLLCNEARLVIATGGGAFMDEAIRAALSATAFTAYLAAPFEVLWARTSRSGTRPLLAGPDGKEKAQRLLAARHPIYATADATIDAAQPVEEVARELIESYHGHWKTAR